MKSSFRDYFSLSNEEKNFDRLFEVMEKQSKASGRSALIAVIISVASLIVAVISLLKQ
jgi:hypothetical protein